MVKQKTCHSLQRTLQVEHCIASSLISASHFRQGVERFRVESGCFSLRMRSTALRWQPGIWDLTSGRSNDAPATEEAEAGNPAAAPVSRVEVRIDAAWFPKLSHKMQGKHCHKIAGGMEAKGQIMGESRTARSCCRIL